MTELAKGGRGKKAPYDSTHQRIPYPLKPIVEQLTANYRYLLENEFRNPEDPALMMAVIQELKQDYGSSPQVEENGKNLKQLIDEFLEIKKAAHHKHWGDKKKFTIDTRSWDAFRDFLYFLEHHLEQI